MNNKTNKVKRTKKFKALIISLSLAFAVALGGACTALGLSLGGDKLRGGSLAGGVADSNVADVPIGTGMSFEISSADQWAEVVAQESSASGYALAKLTANITATGGSFGTVEEESESNAYYHGAFNVPAGKYIVLDLNGYTIDRHLTSAVEFGSVIINSGTLVVRDTNTSGTKGVITGGNTNGGFFSSTDPEVQYGYGGGIFTYTDLTVSNVVIKNNYSSYGGGIQTNNRKEDGVEVVFERTVNVIDCELFGNNCARFGGAMCISGGTTLNVEGSVFHDNKTDEGGGAGINADNAYITVKNSEFYDNTAYSGGGAIRLAGTIGGSLSVTGSTFSNNFAQTGQGGAIYLQSSVLEEKAVISDSTFTNNTAKSTGGAIESYNSMALSNVIVSGNTAVNGGGISLRALTEITDCTISDNTVTNGNGGGIWANAGLTIKSSTVSENIANGSASVAGYSVGRGGGIWIQGGTLTIGEENVTAEDKIVKILNNTAGAGGAGIYAYSSLTAANIYNAKIDGNVTGVGGGGAGYCQSQGTFPLVIKGGFVTNNTADDGGGGVYINGGSASITGTDISYNTAITGKGGGVSIKGSGELTITNGKITHNNSEGYGAGIYTESGVGEVKINGAEITYNNARNNYGGGVFLDNSVEATITAANISYNTATAGAGIHTMGKCVLNLNGSLVDGKNSIQINYNKGMSSNGGGLCSNGTATMSYVTFDHNYTGASGGGISAYNFNADHITVTNNESLGTAGGIRLHSGKTYEIRNSTITGNTSSYGGGGIYQEGNTTLVNVTITGNSAPFGGGMVASSITNLGGTINITNNTGVNANQKNNVNVMVSYPIVPIESGEDAFSANSRIGLNTSRNDGTPTASQLGAMVINTTPDSVAITSHNTIFSADFSTQKITTFAPNSGIKLLYIYREGITPGVGDDKKWVEAATNSTDSNPIQVDFNANCVANKTGSGATVTSSFGVNETGKKGFKDGALHVPAGANIILNLGTYSLDRGLSTRTSAVDNGSVIIVDGTLTIIGSGTITGGYSKKGGGIYVSSTGKLTVIYAAISGNKTSEYGAGIYVDGGTFTMSGGLIYNNTTASNGGGVGVGNKGTFTMNGGYIGATKTESGVAVRNGNRADCGAGVFNSGSTFIMNGGTIFANIAANAGGALYAGGKSVNTITDGVIGNSDTMVGNTATNGGGAIYLNEGSLTMSGGTILGNQTTAGGGGILAQVNTTVTMTGGNIKNNTARHGGGIYLMGGSSTNKGTLNLGAKAADGKLSGNVEISGNHATGTVENGAYNGGGIMAGEYTTINFYGGTIKSNDAQVGGAGIATSGKLNMEGGTITANTATSFGSGVHVSATATVTMSGGRITENTGTKTGGGVSLDGVFTMTGGEISGNTASTNGGGVYVQKTGTFNMGSVSGTGASAVYSGTGKITGNTATDSNGGGVYVNGDASAFGKVNLYSGTISGNTAKLKANASNSDYSSGRGGGVYLNINAKFNMYGGTITENNASGGCGGGVYTAGVATGVTGTTAVTISGGLISKNTARVGGGVLCAAGTTFTMSGGTISENSSSQHGGGVVLQSLVKNTISGGEIKNNTAGAGGGGIYIQDATELTLTNATISNNTASGGAGVYSQGATFKMSSGFIKENTTTYGSGGGLFSEGGTVNISGGEICNNTAKRGGGMVVRFAQFTVSGTAAIHDNYAKMINGDGGHGGGMYLQVSTANTSGNFQITGGSIYNNIADGQGGAIIINGGVTLTISDGEIYGNKADQGGAIRVDTTDTLNLSADASIYGNVARDGGGINVAGTLNMTGGTISANTATGSGGGIYVAGGSATVGSNAADAGVPVISKNASDLMGGGIYANNSTVIINKGKVSANSASTGAGIYIINSTELTMNNGVIGGETDDEGNISASSGGGVSIATNSTFTLNDGAISHNKALHGAGVRVINGSTFAMNGGSVTDNVAAMNGGGLHANGALNIYGGEISGNVASWLGAGMYVYTEGEPAGEINVKGTVKITGNTKAGNESNVYLAADKNITVAGTLNASSEIGVTTANNEKRVFTSGLASSGLSHPNVVFSADNKKYVVGISGNEATLLDCNNINITVYDKDGNPTETKAVIKVDAGTKVTYALNADKSKLTFTSTQGGGAGVTTVVNVPLVAGYTPYVYDPEDNNAEVPSGEGVLESVSADLNLRIGYKANTNTAYTVYYILQASDGSYITATLQNELEGKASVKKYVGSGTTDKPLKYLDDEGKAFATFDNKQHYSFDKVEEDLNIKGDGTTYVRVYLKLNEYTVSFAAPDAVPGMQKKTFKYNLAISNDGIENPAKTGNTFAGWYYDEAYTQAVNFGTDKVTGDVTVYAQFTTKQYTLIFDMNLGDGTNQLPEEGIQVDSANLVSHTVTWDVASLFNSTFKFGEATGVGRYQITYNVNNVSANKNIKSIKPSAIGYTFNGWFAEGASSQTEVIRKPSSTGTNPTPDTIVLTAHWAPASFSMRLDKQDGSRVTSKTVRNMSPWGEKGTGLEPGATGAILPAMSDRAGYLFDGWYVSDDPTDEHYTSVYGVSNSTDADGNILFNIAEFAALGKYGSKETGYNFSTLTIYAGWRSVPVLINVINTEESPMIGGGLIFKDVEGNLISETDPVEIGDEITVEGDPDSGYKFVSIRIGTRTINATDNTLKFTVLERDVRTVTDEYDTKTSYIDVSASFAEERYKIDYVWDGAKVSDDSYARDYSISELDDNSLLRAKLPSLLTKRGYIFDGYDFVDADGKVIEENAYDTSDEVDEEMGLYGAELYLKCPYYYGDDVGYGPVKLKVKWRPQVSYVYLYNAMYAQQDYDYDKDNKRHVIGNKKNPLCTDMDIEITNPSRGESFVFMGWATSRNGVVVYPAENGKNTVSYKVNAHKDEKGNLLNRNNLYAVWHIAGVNYIIMSADNNGCTYGGEGITMSAQTARTYDEDEAADIKLNYTWYKIFEGHYDECFDVKDYVDTEGFKIYVDTDDVVVAYEKEGKYYDTDKETEISQAQAEAYGSKLTYKEFNATNALDRGFCEVKKFINPDTNKEVVTTGLDPDKKCTVNVRNVKDCGVYVCVVVVTAEGEGSTSKTDGYGEIEITMNKAVYSGVDMADTTVAYNTAPRYDMITVKNDAGKDPTTVDTNGVRHLVLPDGSKLIVTYRYYLGTGEARTEITDLNQIKTVGTYHAEVSFAFTPDGDKGNYELPESIDADLIIVPDSISNLQYEFVHNGTTVTTDVAEFNGAYDGEEYKVVAKILDTTGIGTNSPLVTSIDDVAFDVKVYRITDTGSEVLVTGPTTEAGSYYLQIVGLTGADADNYALGSGLTLRADYSIGKKAYDVAGKITFTNLEVPFDNELHTISINLADGFTIPENDIAVVYSTSYAAEVEDFTENDYRLDNDRDDKNDLRITNGGRYAGVYTVTVKFEFRNQAAANNYAALEEMSATLTITKANFFNFYNVDGVDLLRDAGFVNASYAYTVGEKYNPYIKGGMLTDTEHFGLTYEYYRVDEDENGNRLGTTMLASGTHSELAAQGNLISRAGKYEIAARIEFVSALYRNNFEEINSSESTITYVIREVDVQSVQVIWQNKLDENGENVVFDKDNKIVSLGAGFDYGWIQQINVYYVDNAIPFEVTDEADIALAGIKLEKKNNVDQTTFWKVGTFNVTVSFYGKDSDAYNFTVKETITDVQVQYSKDGGNSYRDVNDEGVEFDADATYQFKVLYQGTDTAGNKSEVPLESVAVAAEALKLGSNKLTVSELYYVFETEITVDMYKVIDSGITWQYKLAGGAWTDIPANSQVIYAGAEYSIQATFMDGGVKQELEAKSTNGQAVYNVSDYVVSVGRSGNYKLNDEYSINVVPLVIEVTWDSSELKYNSYHQSPKVNTSNRAAADAELLVFDYEFTDKEGNALTSARVINVGEYVVKLVLTGAASGNYTLDGSNTASQSFSITKADIEMTATYNEYNYGPNKTYAGNPQGLRLKAMKADFGENAVIEGDFAFITNYNQATGKYDIADGAALKALIANRNENLQVRYVYVPKDEEDKLNYKEKIGTITLDVQSQVAKSGAGALSVEFGEDAVEFYLVNQEFDTYGIVVHLLYQSTYEEDGVWYGLRDKINNPSYRIGSTAAQGYKITAQDLSSEKVVLRAISGGNSGTLDVAVVDKVAEKLEVSSTDHRKEYYVGEKFDFSDMVFKVTFADADKTSQDGLRKGTIKADFSGIPDYVDGAFTTVGEKTVMFSYFGKTCTETITVKPKEELQIVNPTNLVLTYKNGETLTAPQLKAVVDGVTYVQSEFSKIGVSVRVEVTDKSTNQAATLGAKKEGLYNVRYIFTVTNPRFTRPANINLDVRVTENPYKVDIDTPDGQKVMYTGKYIAIPKPTIGTVMDSTTDTAIPANRVKIEYTINDVDVTNESQWTGTALNRGAYEVTVTIKIIRTGEADYTAATASYTFEVTQAVNDKANASISVHPVILGEGADFNFDVIADFGADTAVLTYSRTRNGQYTATKPDAAGTWFVKATIAGTDNYQGIDEIIESFEVRIDKISSDMSGEGSVEGEITGTEGIGADWKLNINESEIEDVNIKKQTALYGYTVSLVDANNQPIETSGEYTIKIKLSDEQVEALSGKTVKLFSYDADGKATEIKDAKVKDGYVEFKTSEFGKFVVTEVIPSAPGVPVGLIVGVSLGAVAAAGMIAAVIIVFLKKKRGSQK